MKKHYKFLLVAASALLIGNAVNAQKVTSYVANFSNNTEISDSLIWIPEYKAEVFSLSADTNVLKITVDKFGPLPTKRPFWYGFAAINIDLPTALDISKDTRASVDVMVTKDVNLQFGLFSDSLVGPITVTNKVLMAMGFTTIYFDFAAAIVARNADTDTTTADFNAANVTRMLMGFNSGYDDTKENPTSDYKGIVFMKNLKLGKEALIKPTGVFSTAKSVGTVSVSPNPATDFIEINFAQNQINSTNEVSILNYLGNTVAMDSFEGNNYKMNTASLENGMYFIQVKSGSKNFTGKFIKK